MISFGVSYVVWSLVVLALFVIYMKRKNKYWDKKGVVTPNPTLLLGNSTSIFTQQETIGVAIRNVYQQFKPKGYKYCGYYFLWRPILVVLDLELTKTIMTRDFQHFTDHGNYVNEEIDPLSGHLFSLRGTKWKNLRVKLTPTFTSGKMKMMFQTLLNCSHDLLDLMKDMHKVKEGLDIKDIVARFSTDVIGSCAFGIECSSLKNPDSDFRAYGRKVFELDAISSIKFIVGFVYPDLLEKLKIPDTKPEVSKFFMNIIQETVKYREQNNVTRKDFMQLLIQLKNSISISDNDSDLKIASNDNKTLEPGKTLNISELAAQAYVFYLAGFETSSTTLTFCMYELVVKQDIQDKLRQEIEEVLSKHNNEISYDALMEMTYMDKCINETLRKYPPVPVLTRECTKTYKIPDTELVIEKGTLVFIPAMAIQRDFEIYPDPENFDPERFSPENKAKRHQFAWLPFGEGPRVCIGLRFGMMQTKVALATLIRNYRFTLNPKTKTPLVMDPKSFVLSAEGKIWLNAEKLSAESS